MSEMKYAICEGYVTSKNDGERHFLGGERLARLYGLERGQYKIIRWEGFEGLHDYELRCRRAEAEGLVLLSTRYHGVYDLPTENENTQEEDNE